MDDPDAGTLVRRDMGTLPSRLRRRSEGRRLMRDHELEPLHGAQPALERFACLDDVVHGGIVVSLRCQRRVVGRDVEEGRVAKVVQDWGRSRQ